MVYYWEKPSGTAGHFDHSHMQVRSGIFPSCSLFAHGIDSRINGPRDSPEIAVIQQKP